VSERVLDGMIELARCSRLDRVIVGGATAPELMLGLHCRGYARVATVATCGLPHGQYGVALVNWEGRLIKALETTLDWLVQYLGSSAVLVIRLDPLERTANRRLKSILDNLSNSRSGPSASMVSLSRHAAGTRSTCRWPRKLLPRSFRIVRLRLLIANRRKPSTLLPESSK
jgi:hypothetical protein